MAKKKANSEGQSLGEFRAWLQGIEDMQGTDWAPNLEQWKRIKSKIADIVEDEPPAPAAQRAAPVQAWQPYQQPVPGTQVVTPGPSSLPAPGGPAGPRPHFQQEGASFKTPDIDSSNGYQSSLA